MTQPPTPDRTDTSPRRRRAWPWVVGAVAVLLVLAVVLLWPRGPVGPAYLTAEVESRTVALTAQGTGTVVDARVDSVAADGSWVTSARHGVETGAQTQGADATQVVEVNVSVGDSVTAGQQLGVYLDTFDDRYAILAPSAGVIRSVGVAAGSAPTTEAFTIGVGGYEVVADISEYDIPDVAGGQAVEVSFDALGVTADGVVTDILPAGSGTAATESAVTEYPVVASVEEVPEGTRLAMSVQLTIQVSAVDDVLAVPVQALEEHADGTFTVLRLNDEDAAEEVTVGVGLIGDSHAEITEGLDAGDLVVIGTPDESAASTPTFGPPADEESQP